VSIEQNRRRYIAALRNNPENLTQIFNTDLIHEGKNEACALGLGCVEFGVDVSGYRSREYYSQDKDPYVVFCLIINGTYDVDALQFIWNLNDAERKTFNQIADRLEELWFPAVIQAGDLTEIR
jgi:hypothetical protein